MLEDVFDEIDRSLREELELLFSFVSGLGYQNQAAYRLRT